MSPEENVYPVRSRIGQAAKKCESPLRGTRRERPRRTVGVVGRLWLPDRHFVPPAPELVRENRCGSRT